MFYVQWKTSRKPLLLRIVDFTFREKWYKICGKIASIGTNAGFWRWKYMYNLQSSNFLQRHMESHAGIQKRLLCHLCPYSSVGRQELNNHLLKVHNVPVPKKTKVSVHWNIFEIVSLCLRCCESMALLSKISGFVLIQQLVLKIIVFVWMTLSCTNCNQNQNWLFLYWKNNFLVFSKKKNLKFR